METINLLPEFDKPSYFNLPENIERSSQRIVSGQVISQLRIVMRADAKASKFDKELWNNELAPILNLWKRLNQVTPVELPSICRLDLPIFHLDAAYTFIYKCNQALDCFFIYEIFFTTYCCFVIVFYFKLLKITYICII